MSREWTYKEDSYLVKLLNVDKLSNLELSEILDRSVPSVMARISLLLHRKIQIILSEDRTRNTKNPPSGNKSRMKPSQEVGTVKRKCLRCRQLFIAKGLFNRICTSCNNINSRSSLPWTV